MSLSTSLILAEREKLAQELNVLIYQNNDKIILCRILNKLWLILIPIFIILGFSLFSLSFLSLIYLLGFLSISYFSLKSNHQKLKILKAKNTYLSEKITENQLKIQTLIRDTSKDLAPENNRLSSFSLEREQLLLKKHLLTIEFILRHQKVLIKQRQVGNLSNYLYNQGFTKEDNTYAYFKTLELLSPEEPSLKRNLKKPQ